MKNVQKIILYLTSVLLLGCLGWIFIHAVCAVPQAKNIFKDKNMLPVIMAGTLLLLLLFLKLSVVSRSWQKQHASYRNCGCFSGDSDTAVSVSVLCEILGGI